MSYLSYPYHFDMRPRYQNSSFRSQFVTRIELGFGPSYLHFLGYFLFSIIASDQSIENMVIVSVLLCLLRRL